MIKDITKSKFDCSLFRILIVEDDESLNYLIRKKLKRAGFSVVSAISGKEALQDITSEQNEIILLDISLPDMTGNEIIQEVIRLKGTTPNFIVMTGFGDEKTAVQMMKLGAIDYLVKDSDFIDVIEEKIKTLAQQLFNNLKLKKTEHDLITSKNLLEVTGQMANVGGWELHLDSNEVRWTPETYRIHGLEDGKEINLDEAITFFDKKDQKILLRAINEAAQKGTPYDLELNFTSAKGEKLIVHTKGRAQKENGIITRLIGSFQDVTKLKETEKELIRKNKQLEARDRQIQKNNKQLISHKEELKSVNAQLAAKQKALLASKEKLSNIIEHSTNLFYSHDTDDVLTYVSPQVKEILGYSEQEALINWTELVTDNPVNKAGLERTRLAIETGQIQPPYYLELKKKNGGKIWVEVHEAPVVKNGKTTAIVGSLTDITKRYKAEQKTRESEAFLQQMFDSLQDGLMIINTDFEIVKQNKWVTNNLGIKSSGHPKKCFTALFGKNKACDICPVKKCFETGKVQSKIMKLTNSKGQERWFDKSAHPSFNENGDIDKVIYYLHDITETKLAQEQIRINEERLREAEHIAKMGNITWDVDANKGFWSDEVFRIYERKPALGVPDIDEIIELHIPEDRDRLKKALHDTVNKGIEFELLLHPHLPSGKLKHVLAIAKIVKDKAGNVKVIRGVVKDVTEQKEYESALVEARKKAEESDKLKSAFLANMSHEIRTPMNGILGFTELLKEPDLTSDEKNKFIDIIHKSGERMLQTVNDIVDISKIDAGQVEINYEIFDVSEEINMLYELNNPEAREKGIELNIHNELMTETPLIRCDKFKFQSILNNLINNAIKYTNEGCIDIVYGLDNNWFRFKISDTGVGIPESDHEAIFNRFTRADIKDKQVYEGSGLGLAISKSYIRMLNGNIKVESQPGKGSTFRVDIPCKRENAVNATHAQKAMNLKDKAASTKDLNVLIVEDDDVSFEFLHSIIRDQTRQIKRAADGKEAIDLIREMSFDVVFMDLKLPVLNGYDAVKEIRKFDKDTWIVAQTAYAMLGDREKALEAGCNDYIEKPINKDAIRDLLKKL
jgi:PAS domain S-box-containing protein